MLNTFPEKPNCSRYYSICNDCIGENRCLPIPVFKASSSVPSRCALLIELSSDQIALVVLPSNAMPSASVGEITVAFNVSNEIATRPDVVAARFLTLSSVTQPTF